MSVFVDRDGVWIYDFWEGGKRYKRRAKNPDLTPATARRQAQAAEYLARVAARNEARGQALPTAGDYTLAQAVAARAAEAQHLKHWRDVRLALAEIVEFFGAGCAIADVAARWREYREWARSKKVRVWRGGPRKPAERRSRPDGDFGEAGRARSAARVNRYLDQLSALLRQAHDTIGTDGRPILARMPKIERITEATREPRPVPLAVVGAIEADPKTPAHLRHAAALVRSFGLRLDEVFAARVAWIDRDARALRLPAEMTKANREELLPASDDAMAILEALATDARQRGGRDGHPDDDRVHLIVYRPRAKPDAERPHAARPIKNARRAWSTAIAKHGGGGRWRFHDLRATYVTQLAHVAPSAIVQDLARHRNASTTARYTKIADEGRRAAIEAMASASKVAMTAAETAAKSPTAQSHRTKLRRVK